MFNLEQSILEWRRQMLAAGVKSVNVLDELESHLREDVEKQMREGTNAQQAFEAAARQIGHANVLKAEFAKAGGKGPFGFWSDNKSKRTGCILGLLWLAACSWSFNTVCRQPAASPGTTFVLMSGVSIFIYAAGILGSVFLVRGANWGRSIVRMLALVMVIVCVAQILNFDMPAPWRVWCGIVAVFSLVSIRLLNPPEHIKPKAAK